MNEAFVEVNGVRTKVLTWGRWIEESKGDTDEIILLIPGNPGVVGFYTKFAQTLYEKTNIPVWCVGHAGHNFTTKSVTTFPQFNEHKNLYDLNGQVEHKAAFFKKYVPTDAKVHLVAHSIGSYMSVEILEHPDVKHKIKDVYLLFPTLERLGETKNAKFFNSLVGPFLPFILFLAWIFTILPNFFATLLLQIYMYIHNIPTDLHTLNIIELVKPGVLRRVFFLAFDEIGHVKERNNTIIARNKDKIKLYYSRIDGWVPESFYDDIRKEIPGVDAELTNINHTFVFRHSVDVACSVADWIQARK